MSKKAVPILLSASMMSACSTTSFSPPPVNLVNASEVQGSNRFFSSRCRPEEIVTSGNGRVKITKNTEGALLLIDNFLLEYRCRAHSAANGRQLFEIPSFLALAGTATAAAFGAGRDVSIAGGAANSILSGGKNYYAPKQKASVYDSAVDALLCIKTRSVGVSPFLIDKATQGETDAKKKLSTIVSSFLFERVNPLKPNERIKETIEFSPARKYHELVAAALFSVERITAQRLSETGVFDPAGVVAEIKALSEDEEEAESNAKPVAEAKANILTTDDAAQKAIIQTDLFLAKLEPQLQTCVVRAKL